MGSGYLGTNERYLNAVLTTLTQQFDYDPKTSFQLIKGTTSSAESAILLALHTFCYSDLLDYDWFANTHKTQEEATHG